MFKVTVLMTVFNGGSYLPKAIDSVLKQTYGDFEFLIVDDCSTDGSADYIKKLSDERIVLVRNAVNLGQTKSLNVGLRQARGRYVARMDADDLAYPHWLQEQVSIMERESSCAVLSPKAVVIDLRDKIVKELNTPLSPQGIILKSIFASPINHVGCFMRREAILELGGYDEKYKIIADYALWSKAIEKGYQIKAHPKILVAVRSHAQSVSMLEANNKVIGEMTDVIRKNAASLTKSVLSQPQAVLLWRTVYAGHTLSLSQFLEGIGIIKHVYHSLNSAEAEGFFNQQERVFFLKRAWNLMNGRDFANTRRTARAYIKSHGPLNIFFIIWCLTFGGVLLTLVIDFYSNLISFLAVKKVG